MLTSRRQYARWGKSFLSVQLPSNEPIGDVVSPSANKIHVVQESIKQINILSQNTALCSYKNGVRITLIVLSGIYQIDTFTKS